MRALFFEDKDMAQAWGNYWEKGHSTTFGEYYKDGYTHGYIAKWLKGIIEQCPDKQLNLLEVGCGNTSLLPCLYDLKVEGSYLGIDAATINISSSAVRRQKDKLKVAIGSETAIEDFSSTEKYDLILSVYGLEYSSTDESLPILKNCLSKKGKLNCLMHYADSHIHEKSKQAIKEFDFQTMEDVVTRLRIVNDELNKVNGDVRRLSLSKIAEEERASLNNFISSIMNEDPKNRNPILVDFCQHLLVFFKKIKCSQTERDNHIESIIPDFIASKERFMQMVNVAKNTEQIKIFSHDLKEVGFSNINISKLSTQGSPVAWEVQAD